MNDFFVFVFIETWLKENITDTTIQLDGLNLYQSDRITSVTGETGETGGAVVSCIAGGMCENVTVTKTITNHQKSWITV